jgi:hypothetical protein
MHWLQKPFPWKVPAGAPPHLSSPTSQLSEMRARSHRALDCLHVSPKSWYQQGSGKIAIDEGTKSD